MLADILHAMIFTKGTDFPYKNIITIHEDMLFTLNDSGICSKKYPVYLGL